VILKLTGRAFGPGRPMPIVMKQTSMREPAVAPAHEAPPEPGRPAGAEPVHSPREASPPRSPVGGKRRG
jgi:hypothetical protein